ncbi:MAG: hypothetical protein IBX40_04770 [Methanosarcinales archaeon]|nr:hypothetical protein [Methanosarcinales archaeon]
MNREEFLNKNLLREFIYFVIIVIILSVSISLAAPALDSLLGIDFFLEYQTSGEWHIIRSNNVNALIISIFITIIIWIIRMFALKSVRA